MYKNYFSVHLKLTEHRKPTILQYKTKDIRKNNGNKLFEIFVPKKKTRKKLCWKWFKQMMANSQIMSENEAGLNRPKRERSRDGKTADLFQLETEAEEGWLLDGKIVCQLS